MKSYLYWLLLLALVLSPATAQLSPSPEQPGSPIDFRKFPLVTIAPTHYLKEAPMVGKANPPVALAAETFFRIITDLGSYVHIELASGATGYMPNAPSKRQKCFVVKGRVVHKPWSKSMESWRAGGSDYYLLEAARTAADIELPRPLFLRPSQSVSFVKFKKFAGNRVKIIAILDTPKVQRQSPSLSQRPISQVPIMQRPDNGREKPLSPGCGKGIKVLFIKLVADKTPVPLQRQQDCGCK